jgi:sugar lactone lactonase YvrE
MRRLYRPGGWLLLWLACLSFAIGGPTSVSAAPAAESCTDAKRYLNPCDVAFVKQFLNPSSYMPISEIRPGMVGYGLSVFHGQKIERFNVSVIGVVKKVLNGKDAILVRLSGGPMSNNNVIKGMSGSPVYINEKLIGAVSFGYDFSKEPIAGITPIVDMMDALAADSMQRGRIAHIAPIFGKYGSQSERAEASTGAPRMIPLMSPVSLAGFSQRAEAYLADKFKDIGMSVSSGASGALDATLKSGAANDIKPGGAVSVLLSTGDFNTVATGTVTARFGGKVLAFGHPFLSAGAVDFPMATAFVHQILPSLSASFKVASPVSVVGSVMADRPWSIGGQVGRTSRLIPATFSVTDETRNIKRVFHTNLIDHPDLTPDLLAATAMSAIDATHQSSGPYLAKVETTLAADGIDTIHRIDRFPSNLSVRAGGDLKIMLGDPVGNFLGKIASDITNNDFQKSSIKEAKIDITLQDGHDTAIIERVYVDKPYVAPGDTASVSCVIRPYNKQPLVETIEFQVPRDMPDGNLLIGVSSGEGLNGLKKRMGLVDPQPENLKQVAKKIMDRGRGDALTVVAALPEQSLMIGGTKLINPPAHWAKIFYSNRHTRGPSLVRGELRTAKVSEWLLEGSHILTLEVKNPDKAAAKQAPSNMAASGTDDGISITEQARKTIDASRKTTSSSPSGSSGSSTSNSSESNSAEKVVAAISTAATSTKEYPHMRPALSFKQESQEDFSAGKADGVTVDSWGRMSPANEDIAKKSLPIEMQVWSGTYAKGHFWFGTKDHLYRWKGDASAPEVVATFDGVAIPAIASDALGTVYAASIPGGQVWSVNGTDKPKMFFHTEEPIITSLCTDDQNNLYVGTAGTGRVYKVDPSGKSSVLFNSKQAHVTSLFYSVPKKELYVGTGEKGAVYRISQDGKAQAVYQSPDHLVTGIVLDAKNNLYIATSGQGRLMRILPSGEVQNLATSEAFYTMHYDPSTDSVYSGDGEGDVTKARIDPISGMPYFVPVAHTDEEGVLALASDGQGRLFAGTANLATVRSMKSEPSQKAQYVSAVRDAGRLAAWSLIRAFGPLNEPNATIGSQWQMETRTGDTSQPDETWSSWSAAKFSDNAFQLASPAARYLQYRLSWKPLEVAAKTPTSIGRIELTYLPKDAAPAIKSISLKPGIAVSGKQTISVTGTDPDNDNLLLTMRISDDDTKTWKDMTTNLRAKRGAKSSHSSEDSDSKTSKDDDKSTKKDEDKETKKDSSTTESPHDDSSGKPDAPKEKGAPAPQPLSKKEGRKPVHKDIKKDTKAASKPKSPVAKIKLPTAHESSTSSDSKSSTSGEEFEYAWDTAKLKDGNYLVQFTLDDRLSNPEDHSQGIALRSVTVDNTPPEIEFMDSNREKDGTLKFKVGVKDKFSNIANATFRVDEGSPYALAGLEGVGDGQKAVLGATGLTLDPGSHKLEVKISDAAGNTVTKTYPLK